MHCYGNLRNLQMSDMFMCPPGMLEQKAVTKLAMWVSTASPKFPPETFF